MDLDKNKFISNNFFKRVTTAIFLLVIYFYSTFYNNFSSKLIIYLTSIILSYEWFSITQRNVKKNYLYIFIIFVLFNVFFSTLTNFFFSILFSIILSLLIFSKLIFNKIKNDDLIWLFYGFIYISIPLIVFFEIKNEENGNYYILWLLSIICSTDIFSFLFGNLIKGPRIFPKISPSKTYSGTILGIISGSCLGVVFFEIFINSLSILNIFVLSVSVSLISFIGDLLISKLKRKFNKKDSSNILPGHGGFLDRYDSISFGLIALFFIQYFF